MSKPETTPRELLVAFEGLIAENHPNALKASQINDFHELVGDGGVTPLHIASSYGNKDVISALVKAGANLEAKDDEGKTPLHHAAENARTRAIYHLTKLGANPEARDTAGSTPIDLAYYKGTGDAAVGVVAAALKEREQLSGGKGSRDLVLRVALESSAAGRDSSAKAAPTSSRARSPQRGSSIS